MDWVSLKEVWRLKKGLKVLAIGLLIVAALSFFFSAGQESRLSLAQSSSCHFPAIFNFGDSNSDTGTVSAAFNRLHLPHGMTFFAKPSGRYSDGRLIIDFLAKELGIPFLRAYVDSIGSNYRHGSNYAASGSTIQHDAKLIADGFNPFSLGVQVSQFEQFKARTIELYNQAEDVAISNILPNPEDFSRALYTVDIGQNDLHAALTSMTEEQAHASIPKIIDQFSLSIQQLHSQGARLFWIHNTGPIGCLPFFVLMYPPKPGNADQNGCVKSYNEVAQNFNVQLKNRVSTLRDQLQDVTMVYVDIYSAKYSLINHAKNYGFSVPLGYCCGKIGIVDCGEKETANGTEVHGSSCSDPANYISWDGIHYTEAANKWVASQILNGSFSIPQIPIAGVCEKH